MAVPPVPAAVTASGVPAPWSPAPGRSGNAPMLLGIAGAVLLLLGGAAWFLVPWDTLLRPWRASTATATVNPAGGEAGPSGGATAAPVADEAAAQRARALEAARARLAGVTIAVDAQPWAEVRLVPALSDAEVSSLPPEVVRELAKEHGPFITPFVTELPAGDYMAAFENEGLGLSHTQRITVSAGGENRFEVRLPGFDADRFISDLLRRPAQ